MDNQSISQKLLNIYHQLMDYYGPQHWWPAQEPFEVIVGAILTQSAAWLNVEKAIAISSATISSMPRHAKRADIHLWMVPHRVSKVCNISGSCPQRLGIIGRSSPPRVRSKESERL